jgi:hypothetical protein
MAKTNDPQKTPTTGFVIGRDRFAQISAVEGIHLSKTMKDRIREADRDGLSDQQRREAIIRAHLSQV